MKTFSRDQVATLVDRLEEEPRFLILVAGPRQSGKTTLVKQALAQIDLPREYVALDSFESSTGDMELSTDGLGAPRDRHEFRFHRS